MRRALCAPVAGPRKRNTTLGSFEHIGAPPDAGSSREPCHQLVRWGVKNCLSPSQREAVELYYYQGMTMEEAGRLLGVRPSTVCRRLQGARECLTDFLIQASLVSKLSPAGE